MRYTKTLRNLALTGALLAVAGSLAPIQAQDADDLKRGVARLSLINGDVNVRRYYPEPVRSRQVFRKSGA